ncbi:uncharacterized protein LOC110056260 [Orbicella faveolata]|uniref:uncharacterized protein LOC110056260 n=1 Tax=Orbicella faveolata TaxID=48498 RepID=UPI0009E4A997|nr:uncharacterized protein LOC110056260 [Orbicella faveolata]
MDREKFVRGGISTSQEMCLNYLFYYPRMVNATSYCNSVQTKPVHDFIEKHFPSLNLTSEWSNPLIGRNVKWTNEMVADLRRGYNQAKSFISTCLLERFTNYTLPVPEITHPQPQPKSDCPERTTPVESNSFLVAASRTVVLSLLTSYLMFL